MKLRRHRIGLTIGLFATGPFLAGLGATSPLRATKETPSYRLELDIGDVEKMWSKAEAERLKPADGEIMVGGRMDGGSQADPAIRHLELHVRSKTTGMASRDAKVDITVADAGGKQRISVPIAVMYGLSEGEEDWHYGNNFRLAAGRYIVFVSVNREVARFEVTIADR